MSPRYLAAPTAAATYLPTRWPSSDELSQRAPQTTAWPDDCCIACIKRNRTAARLSAAQAWTHPSRCCNTSKYALQPHVQPEQEEPSRPRPHPPSTRVHDDQIPPSAALPRCAHAVALRHGARQAQVVARDDVMLHAVPSRVEAPGPVCCPRLRRIVLHAAIELARGDATRTLRAAAMRFPRVCSQHESRHSV